MRLGGLAAPGQPVSANYCRAAEHWVYQVLVVSDATLVVVEVDAQTGKATRLDLDTPSPPRSSPPRPGFPGCTAVSLPLVLPLRR
jgi:hypothetical protein